MQKQADPKSIISVTLTLGTIATAVEIQLPKCGNFRTTFNRMFHEHRPSTKQATLMIMFSRYIAMIIALVVAGKLTAHQYHC